MSYEYTAVKNRHPKVAHQKYLISRSEPSDHHSSDVAVEHERQLFGDSSVMRRKFRNIAYGLRHKS